MIGLVVLFGFEIWVVDFCEVIVLGVFMCILVENCDIFVLVDYDVGWVLGCICSGMLEL